jgi:type I restriction enzyme S subunit
VTSKFVSSEGHSARRVTGALTPLSQGDVVIVLSDLPNGKALGKAYLVGAESDLTLNQRVMAVTSPHIEPEFLYHLLDRNPYFLAFDNGESQTHLKLKQVLDCPLAFPSKADQQQIALELSTAKALVSQLTGNLNDRRRLADSLRSRYLMCELATS